MTSHATRAQTPPQCVHKIMQWQLHDKSLVLQGLVANLSDDCVLTPSNLAAIDPQGYWRWRMGAHSQDLRVLLERPGDVQLFEMAWL